MLKENDEATPSELWGILVHRYPDLEVSISMIKSTSIYSTAHIKLDTRMCVHACMHTLNGVYKCIMWRALSVQHATAYMLNTKYARHEYPTYSTH